MTAIVSPTQSPAARRLSEERGCPPSEPYTVLAKDNSMGAVMRCPTCDAVVLRVARTPTGLWLDPTGARLVVMAGPTAPPA